METTIKIHKHTKAQLDLLREFKNESYDEVIQKVLYIVKKVKKEPELSKETVEQIEKARERFKRGIFYTEEQVRKRLGL